MSRDRSEATMTIYNMKRWKEGDSEDSEATYVRGVPWKLEVWRYGSYLHLHLHCNIDDHTGWSCKARYTSRRLSVKDGVRDYEAIPVTKCFSNKDNHDYADAMNWDDAMNPDQVILQLMVK